jgi:hypothetical protein
MRLTCRARLQDARQKSAWRTDAPAMARRGFFKRYLMSLDTQDEQKFPTGDRRNEEIVSGR